MTGANGTGPGQLSLTGYGTGLYLGGTVTLDNAVVNLGGATGTSSISSAGGIFGPNLIVNQTGTSAVLTSSVVNRGTINATANGHFAIRPGTFKNQGLINISNNDTVTTGSVSGVFKNFYPTVITGNGTIALATGGELVVAGTIDTGQTIDFLDGTGRLNIGNVSADLKYTVTEPGTFNGMVTGFRFGDSIDFILGGGFTSYAYSGGKLSLYGDGTLLVQVNLSTVVPNPIFALNGGSIVTLANTTPQDFDGDSLSEILLHSTSNGTFVDWTMSGAAITAAQNLTFNGSSVAVDGSWSVPGTGDFDGDGKTDILPQNTNGSFANWTMDGSTIASAQNLTFNGAAVGLDSSWWVPGLGDFNGDGKTDILLRHTDGSFVDWTMNGSTITAAANLTFNGAAVHPDFTWFVATLGDFGGDGKSDILLRNSASGALVDWAMNGSTITTADNLTFGGAPVSIDGSWTILGSGDFDGDGKSDILLQNTAGAFVDWTMNGATIVSAANVTFQGAAVAVDSSWTFADIGDYNGDGKADILLRNTNGSFVEWAMNGPTIATAGSVTFNGSTVMIDGSWRT